MQKYICSICGYVYDEAIGVPENGIMAGTQWADISSNFVCPICNAPKDLFTPAKKAAPEPAVPVSDEAVSMDDLRELSAGEISVICSNLAKGCEKQQLIAEMDAFNTLADYFKSKTVTEKGKTMTDVAKMLDNDLSNNLSAANIAAKAASDRGAMRSIVWSEKVSVMLKSLLDRFTKEGDDLLKNTKIYVCDICGFIYIGDTPPEVCPVCKVPNYKITQVERC